MIGKSDWLERRSRLAPGRVAVIDSDTGQRWTYGDLRERAIRLARFLHSHGVGKGDRVALLAPNHLAYLDMLWACARLGAIFVPLNWRLAATELAEVVNDCTPSVLFVHARFADRAAKLAVSHTVVIEDAAYLEVLSAGAKGASVPEPIEIDPEDPLLLLYTGGTTGKPKGAVLPHRAVLWNAVNTVISWGLTAEDVTLTSLPMFHTGGLNALTVPLLVAGGTVVLTDGFDPERAMRFLDQYGCTIALMVPTMYHRIMQTEAFRRGAVPLTVTYLSGGASCPRTVTQAFLEKGAFFRQGYGLTEAGPNNFFIDPRDARRKPDSVGKPMLFNEVRIVRVDGREALPGEVGELLIRGPHVFAGYWNNPAETAAAFTEGWLRTGDLATVDDEGDVFIVGRKKEMIITGGENVYPAEVESVILEHPAVREAAVVGLSDETWGEVVAAAVVLYEGETLTVEALQAHCASRLGRYKVPKRVVFVPELPKTDVGKLDRKRVVALVEEGGTGDNRVS